VKAGVLSSSQAEGFDLDSAIARRTFAVWMWRAIGSRLQTGIAHTNLIDIAGLSAEEQEAVNGLAAADIIRGDSNRTFHGDSALTLGAEQALIGRAMAALRLR
jgi:hypothetical protein